MGKRKSQSKISETLFFSCEGGEDKEALSGEEEEEKSGRGFFSCYLLTSLSPRHKGQTYIGYTVNPRRRIRQHNGEIRSGAWRTKRKRPWEMVMCIYGFPTNVSALQFEWAWQHPTVSLAVREAAATFKSLRGLASKIKLSFRMLTLPSWQNLNLTVNFFSTKYKKHTAGCPSLPEKMRVQVGSMDELPCYTGSDHNNICEDEDDWDDDEEICNKTSSACGFLSEELTDAKFDSHRDNWKSIEESGHNQNGQMEDIDTRQSGDLLSSAEDHRQPLSPPTSPVQMPPSFFACTFSTLDSVKDRGVFALIEEISVELDRPASKELPTKRVAVTDQPPLESPIVPCEVEVVDLSSPSPVYRISSRSKKRRVSNVCPETIDLTKSPIFV